MLFKRMKFFVCLLSLFLLFSAVYSKNSVGFHPKVRKITENIYSMGITPEWKGYKNVQTIALIKTVNGSQAYGIAPEMFGFTELSCCSFIAPGSRWRDSTDLLVDPTNSQGLSDTFVMNAVTAAANAWDDQVSFQIFNSITQTTFGTPPTVSSPDGQNTVFFMDLNDLGGLSNTGSIIAVTFLHGIWGGNSLTNEVLEADIVFNVDFQFGDGDLSSSVMDLEAISAHEFGHFVGHGHSATSSLCADVTMYPTAVYGETKKRTLEDYDIACVKTLYSEPGFNDSPDNFVSSGSEIKIGMAILFLLILGLN